MLSSYATTNQVVVIVLEPVLEGSNSSRVGTMRRSVVNKSDAGLFGARMPRLAVSVAIARAPVVLYGVPVTAVKTVAAATSL